MTRACVLALFFTWTLQAQPGGAPEALRIRAIPSESTSDPAFVATYEAGSRATTGITIEVTSAGGQPVEGAMVTLQMPSNGATGQFRNNTRTEILTTGPDGKVEAWGMLWNATQGSVALRISASKDLDRGTATARVLLTAPPPRQVTRDTGGGVHGHKKLWIAIAAVAGASVAVAGVARNQNSNSDAAPAATTAITIGSPTIVITRPSARPSIR